MLEGLRRISNHLSTAAHGFKPARTRAKKTNVKSARKNSVTAPTEISGQTVPQNPQIIS
jgi:hypothetical protein